jgi:hypothetical protein
MSKFKVGDIVIPNSGAFEGTKCKINKHIRDGQYVVESLNPYESRGHQAGGVFDTERGWGYYEKDLESAEPVEDTVTIRFLTEQEFKHRGIWDEANNCPDYWDVPMKFYLGKTITLPSSKIRSDGCFHYDDWRFEKNNYEIVTPSTKDTVTVPQPEVESEVESKSESKFKKGDKIIPNCYPFYDTPCEVIQDLDYEGDYRIKSLRLNEDRGDVNDDKAYVSFRNLEKATLVTEEPKSELELAKEQFPIGCYVIPNTGPFKDVVCKVVYHNVGPQDEWIGVESPIAAKQGAHECHGYAGINKGWYYKVSEIVKTDPPKEEPVQACKFKVGDRVTYVGDTYKLKEELATVVATKDSHPGFFDEYAIDSIIEFDKEFINTHYCIINGFKFTPSGKGYFAKENEIVISTHTEEELVKPTEWIPTTKLINPKTDVNLSPELEYHQEPQIIKKPIKKNLITI